ERLEDVLQGNAAQVLELDVDSAWRDAAADTSTTLPQPEDAIYVIYTSGSTGQPKGAEVRHSGEVNLQSWYINDLGLTAADRFLLMGAFGFDLTQKNLFAPLLVGGALVIPDMSDFDLEVIARTLESENITVVNCAPSAFYPLVEDPSKAGYPFPSLRYLILGGEPIRQEALLPWLKAGGCKLVNSYGPTECTDVVSYHVFDPARDSAVIPIGKAIGNTQLYIVDNADHLLPPGIVGELCIGGAGVGNGYLNRPELSQSVFQQNPYCSEGQWYRTGDLVRARPDGTIEYVGRKDFQVKIRGLRIELGEIEAALNGLPEVQDSLILVKNEQLVAYVIAPAALATESVKARLRSSLPDYMVPASVVTLEQWPLTPNGKVDRKALPDPDHSGRPPYVAPRNETEEKLAQIWSEVLGVSDIGIHDSFFDLGGHSLLAARAVSKFRQAFEVDIQLRSLFELHTIADIAQYLDTMKWAAQTAEQQVGSSAEESGRDEGFL
ncbi:MAG: non-ribosomal peptide synthetase, partial [Ketobacter sp.]|nr:non-ribosomal peptide synthetase [Ketobacter sp.]